METSKVKSFVDLKNDFGTGREDLEDSIREKSAKICARRKQFAGKLAEDIEKIKGERELANAILQRVRKSVSALLPESELNNNDIILKCDEYQRALDDYMRDAITLQKRFENKKIKVIVFGRKSMGKSLFTQLYTGLGEDIVSTKRPGDDLDKTGALNVIMHSSDYKQGEQAIRVVFKNQETVRSYVNDCIVPLLKLGLKLPETVEGIYPSWAALNEVLSDPKKKSIAYSIIETVEAQPHKESIDDVMGWIALLKGIFEMESDFSDISRGAESIEITKEELPIYNNIQNSHKRKYLEVRYIEIILNLGHNGMFENFEICDTKGMSVSQGAAKAEKEILKEINDSDAAFSIQRIGQGRGEDAFYNTLNNNRGILLNQGISVDLHNKHFAVFNLDADAKPQSVKKTIDCILKYDLARKIYIGSLISGVEYEEVEIDPRIFVETAIVDMLAEITDSTTMQDQMLIEKCNSNLVVIYEKKRSLIDSLNDIEIKICECDKDRILIGKIKELQDCIVKGLDKIATENNVRIRGLAYENLKRNSNDDDPSMDIPDESSDNLYASNEEYRVKRIFSMIAGNAPSKEIDDLINKHQESKNLEQDAVDSAIRYVIARDVRPKAGSDVCMDVPGKGKVYANGSVQNIGSYIDSVSYAFYEIMRKNINEEFAPSTEILGVQKLNDAVFRMIWNGFKLDVLYENFNKDVFDKYQNEIVQKMKKIYSVSKSDPTGSYIIPEVSFNILKEYFRVVNGFRAQSAVDLVKPIIDWHILVQSIVEVYRRFDLKGRIEKKLAEECRMKENLFDGVIALLVSQDIPVSLIDMYSSRPIDELRKAEILSDSDYRKIKNKENWQEVINARNEIDVLNITSLQVI